MTKFEQLCKELESEIESVYQNGITMEEAEKLAAKFLSAQIKLTTVLKEASLDAKMRKSGTKTLRASVYLTEAKKTDKKPSDVMLEALVETNSLVTAEQNKLHEAEEKTKDLERYFDIFREAHIFCRGVSRGKFE